MSCREVRLYSDFSWRGLLSDPPFQFLDQGPLFNGLGDIGTRADVDRHLTVFITCASGHHDDWRLLGLRPAAQRLNHFITVELGHLEIGEDQPELLGRRLPKSFLSVHGSLDFISSGFQHPADELSNTEGIVDQQNVFAVGSGFDRLFIWNFRFMDPGLCGRILKYGARLGSA